VQKVFRCAGGDRGGELGQVDAGGWAAGLVFVGIALTPVAGECLGVVDLFKHADADGVGVGIAQGERGLADIS
jgi:hypothetical protein